MHYILLGRSADLAFAEVEALAKRFGASQPARISTSFCSLEGVPDAHAFCQAGGSVVKVYESLPENDIDKSIANDLIQNQQDHFALSSFQRSADLKNHANRIKDELKAADIKPHFRILVDPFESAGITTKTTEYCCNDIAGLPQVLKTVAVQDLYYWTEKDYGRPAIDPHSGMMPPKIARTMLNLALPQDPTSLTAYDPFCGSGTILVEALDLGCDVIGSDLSTKAVNASRANCDWFIKKHQLTNQSTVFEADAVHISNQQIRKPVDAIVFEGYLGPPSPEYSRIPDIMKGMEKMYRGVFKHLYSYLAPNGYLVCALPEFTVNERVKNLDDVIDWARALGYTRCAQYTYGRPQAVVKRSIYVLQKKCE